MHKALSINSLSLMLRSRGRHIANLGSFFGIRLFSLLLYAVSVSSYINSVSADAYGTLSLLLIVFAYLQMFDLGMGYAINTRFARRLARGSPNPHAILRRAVPFYLAAGLCITLALLLSAEWLSSAVFGGPQYAVHLRLMSGAVAFLVSSALCTAILNAYNRVYLVNISRLLLDVVRAGALLLGAKFGGDLTIIVVAMVVGSVLKFGVDFTLASKLIGGMKWALPELHWRDLRLNLRYGMPLIMTVFIGIFMNTADKIYIGHMFTKAELANYVIAFDVNTKAYFIIWAVNSSLYNVLVRRKALGTNSKNLIWISVISALAISLMFYLPIWLFSEQIISLWINPAFARSSHSMVSAMAIASCIYMMMSVFYNVVQSAGKPLAILTGDLLALFVLAISLVFSYYSSEIKVVIYGYALAYSLQLIYLYRSSGFTLRDLPGRTRRTQ